MQIKEYFTSQKNIKPKKIADFLENLADYLNSGIDILTSLDLLENQSKDKEMKSVIGEVKNEVETGSNLSDALNSTEKFPCHIINILRAGEESDFEKVLSNTADFLNKIEDFKSKTKSSLVYPVIIVIVMVVVMTIMLGTVVPKFAKLFMTSGIELPTSTKILLKLSEIAQLWPFFSTGILLLFLLVNYYYKTQKGKEHIDTLLLKIPFLGELLTQITITRLSNNLSILRKSGVSILKSLGIVTKIIDNTAISKVFKEAQEQVEKGKDLSSCLKKHDKLFPKGFIVQIEVGENTANLPTMLEKLANRYEQKVNNKLETILSAIKPLSIVVMAVLGGGIVFGIMDAMFSMFSSM